MMKQTLNVVPQGLIESGTVTFSIDPATGLVDYQDTVVAGIGWLNKTIANSGELKIDPTLLLSKGLTPGLKLVMGAVTIYMTDKPGEATISVNDPNMQLSGTVSLDLSSQFFVIKHAILSGSIAGAQVTLELVA